MSDTIVVDLARNALLLAASLAGPMLLVALIVGLIISILQAVTQIQEQTLAFVPKLTAVAMVFLIGLPWMIQTAVRYTTELLRSIPNLASSTMRSRPSICSPAAPERHSSSPVRA